jgi:hypothetical protein
MPIRSFTILAPGAKKGGWVAKLIPRPVNPPPPSVDEVRDSVRQELDRSSEDPRRRDVPERER